jgi:hypothetical protein
MPNTGAKQALVVARESLARPMDFEQFLAKLSPKDRVSAEKRVAVLETAGDPARAALWKRLACALMTLAPHAAKLVGKQTLQVYVADGRYRMQVFALEDLQDGNMTVYSPDVIAEAMKAGVVSRPARPVDAQAYTVGETGEPLRVEALDAKSLNPAAHFKDMTGWNRKAVRITLPPGPSAAQVEAAELMCALAAQHFPRPTGGTGGTPAAGG